MRIPSRSSYAPNGMVCSIDHLASEAGLAMLRRGGTAADAAVAASAVLGVTCQPMCGMGGDLLAVVHPGGGFAGPPSALDASGRAGSGADPDRLRIEGRRHMPFSRDVRCVPVPGCVDGWVQLSHRYGRLPMDEVLAPAISLGEEGFPASQLLSSLSSGAHHRVAEAPELAGPIAPGQRVRRPGVAAALQAVADRGRDGFYLGSPGTDLLELGAGEYSWGDLAGSHADWVPALGCEAWGHLLWTVPPASQGYLTLAGAWMASRLELPSEPGDPEWAHLLVESARQAGHDRLEVLHESARGEQLLDPSRLERRRAAIDPWRRADLGDSYSAGDTIAVCAVDADRQGVSLLQSVASAWGARLALAGSGIFLHNRGTGFSLEAGHPGEYRPGRRPAHTLSPLIVTGTDGGLEAVLGTMGGDSQPQVLLQLLARLLTSGEDPASAVSAGRWVLESGAEGEDLLFGTWGAGGRVQVALEGHAPGSWDRGLRDRGHDVVRRASFDGQFGHAHLIDTRGTTLVGAADPRPGDGTAAGW